MLFRSSIGIAQGTIYIYFNSKEDLFQEILRITDYHHELINLKILISLPISAKGKLRRLSTWLITNLQEDELFAAKIALNTQILLEQNTDSSITDSSITDSHGQNKLYQYTGKIIEQGQKEHSMIDSSLEINRLLLGSRIPICFKETIHHSI